MTDRQRTFFDAPFQSHSDTSRASAAEIKPETNNLRLLVLDYLASRGDTGATDDEMQIFLGLNPSTQRPRRVELVQKGMVVASDKKRRTQAGRLARVWVYK